MFCSMSGVGIKHSLKQLLCCSIKNVCNHQTCPKAPKLLFSLSIQWFLFKQKKRNCAAWTKPEHISPSISQDLRRDALLLPCSPRAVSHPSFLVQCHCVAAAAGCLSAGAAHPGESCWANKLVCWDSRGQDFSPFNANSLELGFNLVQWTYGRQGSICLIASGLCQPGSYSFNKKKKAAAGHFEVLIIFLKLVSTVFQLECGIYSHCFIMRQAQTRRHPLFLKPFIWTAKQAVVAIKCPSLDKVPAWSSGKNRDSSKYCIG